MNLPLIDNCLKIWLTILSRMLQQPVQIVVSTYLKRKNAIISDDIETSFSFVQAILQNNY